MESAEIRTILANPAIPIFFGLFLEREDDVVLRSWILLVLAIWLVVDIFFYTRNMKVWKNVMFCGLAGTVAAIQLFLMAHWISKDLSAKQEDVYRNMRAEASLTDATDARSTRFLVRNIGGTDILVRDMSCGFAQLSVGGAGQYWNDLEITRFADVERLHYGGEAESNRCIDLSLASMGGVQGDVDCVKVEIGVDYVLVDQEDVAKTKKFHFFGLKANETFSWIQENAASENCSETTAAQNSVFPPGTLRKSQPLGTTKHSPPKR